MKCGIFKEVRMLICGVLSKLAYDAPQRGLEDSSDPHSYSHLHVLHTAPKNPFTRPRAYQTLNPPYIETESRQQTPTTSWGKTLPLEDLHTIPFSRR